jgi:hypothetical protein
MASWRNGTGKQYQSISILPLSLGTFL